MTSLIPEEPPVCHIPIASSLAQPRGAFRRARSQKGHHAAQATVDDFVAAETLHSHQVSTGFNKPAASA